MMIFPTLLVEACMKTGLAMYLKFTFEKEVNKKEEKTKTYPSAALKKHPQLKELISNSLNEEETNYPMK